MLREVEKLRTEFNKSLNQLEQVYQKTKQSLDQIKGKVRRNHLSRFSVQEKDVSRELKDSFLNCVSLLISVKKTDDEHSVLDYHTGVSFFSFCFASVSAASAIASSVALYSNDSFKCLGPFSSRQDIIYKHVFINLGHSYDENTGVFTVPRPGVYSLALTVYSDAGASGTKLAACAGLQVNGLMVTEQSETNKQDQEDSATTVVAINLKAGDIVSVSLGAGCFLCDDQNHYNTFSVFLLYAE